MRSGQLAHLTAVSADTLRHYERLGLLPLPQRTAGNYRECLCRDRDYVGRGRYAYTIVDSTLRFTPTAAIVSSKRSRKTLRKVARLSEWQSWCWTL